MSATLPPELELICHGLSAAVGAVITTLLLYPIDNIKTKMQISTKNSEEETEKKKQGFYDILQESLKNNSYKDLYQGLGIDVVASIVANGTYFFWYEYIKKIVNTENSGVVGYFKSASIASLITTIITNPFKVINTKMIFNKDLKLFECIKDIKDKDGLVGFFKGLLPSLLLIINPIIQYIIYEKLKIRYKDTQHKAFAYFLSGAVSKAIATFLTYPCQVVRTNIQVEKNKGIFQVIEKIYKEKNIAGFFQGLPPKLVQSVINSALMLVLYEKIFYSNKLLLLIIFKKRITI